MRSISDKALSLKYPDLIKQIKKYKNIGRASDRRVILEWLKNNIKSAKEIIDEINNNGFQTEDLVIGLIAKERELKIKPRLFAILTLIGRFYFVITEELVSEHILPYFPQITINFSGSDLQKKLFSITKSQAQKSVTRSW